MMKCIYNLKNIALFDINKNQLRLIFKSEYRIFQFIQAALVRNI